MSERKYILRDEYHANIQSTNRVDVSSKRTEIYELMELGKKRESIAESHPHLLREWHPTKNGTLTPNMVTRGSDKIVWWKCEKGHTWDDSVAHRVSGRGCPVCSQKRIIEGENDVCALYPDLMQEWNYEKNLEINPHKCGKSDGRKVWWKCKSCGNEWQSSIASHITGRGCPICACENRKRTK